MTVLPHNYPRVNLRKETSGYSILRDKNNPCRGWVRSLAQTYNRVDSAITQVNIVVEMTEDSEDDFTLGQKYSATVVKQIARNKR